MTVVQEIQARAGENPDHPAMVEQNAEGTTRSLTYRELVARVDEAANAMNHQGLRPSDRVGLLAPQGKEYILHALAVIQAGFCLVPIADDYSGEALEGFCRKASLHGLINLRDGHPLKVFRNVPPVDGSGDEAFRQLHPAYLRFTSGTTHERKGVILGHRAILDRLAAANRALRIGPEDRVLWLLPIAHHLVVSIFLYLRFGATVLLPYRNLPEPLLSLAERWKPTIFYASPYHYEMIAQAGHHQGLEKVRLAISTATALSESAARRFYEATEIPLSQALGVIEMGLPVINLERPVDKPLSLGQVLPDYEVWLRREDGTRVRETGAEAGVGEICIRGPGAFDAYLNPWVPARQALEPDGFRTGDLGYFDQDGDLFLLGRRHNRINMAGMKFFCEEVEQVLEEHPAIRECRVFGKPHPHLGEIPLVELVLTPGAEAPDQRELSRFCQGRLSRHKIPVEVTVVEALAKTPTGKIRRW